jgi:hypothetical protein
MRPDPTSARPHTGTTTPAADTIPTPHGDRHTPARACHHPHTTPAPVSSRPAVQLTAGSTLALIAGGTAAVLVIGAVLVSMLLAVAITAMSLAVVAVVLRSILADTRKGR